VTHGQLSEDWIAATRAQYLPLIEGRQRPQDAGERVLYDESPGSMHLSPVVSPDGRYVAFFGRRDIFTVDLYVADARTGEIVHRLTSPNRDQHFDALSFIQSAGTWSPDGTRFAFVVFAEGDHQLAIMDIASRRVVQSYTVTGVGAVQSPAWSPDGRNIAFTGMAGGLSDIYILDVEGGSVRQLTDDRYARLHPAWSPDGTTLAYVTDEPGSDMERLVFGEMRIGLMNVQTRSIRMLDLFPLGKHINPQFSPDGRDLYFIADPHGFSDLYRVELGSGQIHQVTQLATGISGITKLSPALSVAMQTGRLMFSVFENSGTNIYALDLAQAQGHPVETTGAPITASAAVLPPAEAYGSGLVYEYLNDPHWGLPVTRQFATRPYRTRIGLDFVGPPSFGVGVTEFGTGVSGGVSFYFSDMLGDNQIAAVVQANGGLQDVGGVVQYVNLERRWNWGGVASHIPYLMGWQFLTQEGNRIVLNQQLDRIFVNQAQLLTQYPFSQTRRFEAQGGYTRYGFSREVIRYYYDLAGRPTGQAPEIQEQPSPDALHFFESSIAYVGDNSFFGFTSPVAGQRFRFQVSPTFGTLTYQTALVDYRRYHMVQPFTFAARAVHYGRYGQDAQGRTPDGVQVMSEPFLGFEPLIRGYSWGSFRQDECVRVSDAQEGQISNCPALERLFGTRLALANFEIRIPVLGFEEYGLINFPYLPLEIAPFFDAGMAWRSARAERDDFGLQLEWATRTDARVPVFSTGISARANLMGYLILEAYYAYPFQRPDRGWHWGLQIQPGW
jgi:hypothetical protein